MQCIFVYTAQEWFGIVYYGSVCFSNVSQDSPTSLPLSPSLEVAGVDVKNCSYFNSFTVPLKLAFLSSEPDTTPIHAIFKVRIQYCVFLH